MYSGRTIALATAAVLVGVVGSVYVASQAPLARHFTVPNETVRALTDPTGIAHGRHLAAAICAKCHGPDLGGQIMIDGMPFARVYAPNLTTGPGGAAGQLSDAQLEAVIRHGVLPTGRSAIVMPAEVFNPLADNDLDAILGALRAAPPVDRHLPPPAFGPVGRTLLAMGKLQIQSAAMVDARGPHQPAAPPISATLDYGRYLTLIGGCVLCHGVGLSGGPIPNMGPRALPAANLTPAGLGQYTEADFVRALRTGVRPNGVAIDTIMPWRALGALSDSEIGALYAYLRTVPPRPYGQR